MEIFKGKSVYGGIAVGTLQVISNDGSTIKRIRVSDTEKELERYEQAKQTAGIQLDELYDKAVKEVGEQNAAIFEIHRMMLDDEDYNDSVTNIINTQSVNAEYAVSVTGDNFSNMFASMDDEYMKARSADVKDISERLVRELCGVEETLSDSEEARIILADDLAPSQTVQLEKDKVLSFVTVHGSSNSHTAILAKTMNIPSIIGCKITLDSSLNGRMAVVDGYEGVLYLDPDEQTLNRMKQRQQEDKEKQELLYSLKGKENITLDGRKIKLYANIGNIKDLAAVFMNDAEGIGLFRSEFIYLERNDFPTEEEQFLIYKKVAETMAGKKVIIRTLDIGADKQADYFDLGKEANPAMGCRAIRICLKRPDIFKTQLRAIFRAAVFGNISVMYPMITSLNELERIHSIVAEAEAELTSQGLEFARPEQGIMIETPAAVMISDLLAKEVDFFSIGTNDLTQYTLAADRQNASVEEFYDSHHPAVLRMIQMVIENAHKNGIWAGICGELGADTTLTKEFLHMGIDELSVTPSAVLKVRRAIRETDLNMLTL
ncbi:MAG: phosphoenolpyruvate--protein phosphotransferase [Oscillospiraceae bacterium]